MRQNKWLILTTVRSGVDIAGSAMALVELMKLLTVDDKPVHSAADLLPASLATSYKSRPTDTRCVNLRLTPPDPVHVLDTILKHGQKLRHRV